MKISVLGSTGAMGGFVIKAALQEGFTIQNRVSSKDSIDNLFKDSNAIIDFSCPIATESMLRFAAEKKTEIPMVIGTTGLSRMLAVYAISKLLGDDFDTEILDIHHRLKKDAPSGTAIMLGKTIARARGKNFSQVANFVRYGIIEQRKRGEVGFSVQRCGNVIGTHEISFMGEFEDLKIRHEAHSKEIFAKGAVQASKWIIKQQKGLYTMNDFTKDLMVPMVKSLYKEFFTSGYDFDHEN